MNKDLKGVGLVAIVVTLLTLIALGTAGWLIRQRNSSNTMTKEEAIMQAMEYQPNKVCPAVMTPAIHKDTGATYTFNSGCIPSSWEAE